MSHSRKRSSPAFAILAIIVASVIVRTQLKTASAEDVDAALHTEANRINARLPTMVDEITRLDRVSVGTRSLTYHYTLPTLSFSDIDGLMDWDQLESFAQASSRKNKDFMKLFDYDITVNYVYEDRNGEEAGSFDLTPEEMR